MKKVVIIGGGIIGLTLANYLDKTKFDVTVIDSLIGQALGYPNAAIKNGTS